jgi:uncharacterized protein YndB with AHSA1/START domain
VDKLLVQKSIEINAPAAKVWAVLTTPRLNSRWSGLFGARGPIDSDWTPGSQVLWKNAEGKVYVKGKVLEAEPNKRLQFSVRSTQPELQPLTEQEDLTQTYVISEKGNRASLTILHGDFAVLPNGQELFPRATVGWDRILTTLKALAEEK